MALVTKVKVGNITNLSDARYCSGMGVDRLGFNMIEKSTGYLPFEQFEGIKGWIHGPQVVGEIYGMSSIDQYKKMLQNYKPNFLEMSLKEFEIIKDINRLPIMLSMTDEHFEIVTHHLNFDQVESIIINESRLAEFGKSTFHKLLFIRVKNPDSIKNILTKWAEAGIVLSGSHEQKPGLKSYEGLADVLEQLDEV